MKFLRILPFLFLPLWDRPSVRKNESGQTIFEFLLLLLILTTVSFASMKLVNGQMASYWELLVKLIVDPYNRQNPEIRIP